MSVARTRMRELPGALWRSRRLVPELSRADRVEFITVSALALASELRVAMGLAPPARSVLRIGARRRARHQQVRNVWNNCRRGRSAAFALWRS